MRLCQSTSCLRTTQSSSVQSSIRVTGIIRRIATIHTELSPYESRRYARLAGVGCATRGDSGNAPEHLGHATSLPLLRLPFSKRCSVVLPDAGVVVPDVSVDERQ